jgi:hypothetical protein
MAENDSFLNSQTQEQQSEYLKSINQSMIRLVDVNERGLNSSSQFFQGNSVQSTVSSLRDITQGAYDRFSDDLISTRDTFRSTSQRFGEATTSVVGTVRELRENIPTIQPLAPIGASGYFGLSAGYSTNYKSTFWNDLWAAGGLERAPQTMFQSDFSAIGHENFHARLSSVNPLRLAANIAGISTDLDEDVISSNMAISQRYTRYGTSRALSGVGSTRGDVIGVVENERMKLLDKLGYNYDEFNAAKQVFAAGGQFVGTKSEMERSHVTFQGIDAAEKLAKVLAVPIQDAARAMMDVRGQLGITSIAGQTNFIQQTQAIGMASGLSFQEAMGGALAGAGIARASGFSVRAGGTLGRDILASVNGAYLDRAIGENLIQSAGGVQNLSSSLANSAIQFATGPGSMYYLASMRGNEFNQQAFNQASGGFAQLGNMAASNASTIQGYANFVANVDNLQSQGGSFNAMAMQRSHMNNIFKSATGRDHDPSSSEDTNMMKMLAASSGMFTDPTTAKAFVEMNFTESGQESMYATQRDAYKAEKNLRFKSSIDERFKGNSLDAIGRSISNVWNKPSQALRGWFNDTFEDMGGTDEAQRRTMWATGQMPLGRVSAEDVSTFGEAGGFSRNLSNGELAGPATINSHTPDFFARGTTGAWEGAKVGGAIVGGASILGVIGGLGLMGIGAALSATGIGAAAGVPLMALGGSVASASFFGGMTATVAGVGVGAALGAGYGISEFGSTDNYLVPGFATLQASKDGVKKYDNFAKAWNRGGGFNTAEKNTMGDPDFQKKVIEKLASKGLTGMGNKITDQNSVKMSEIISETADELGVPLGMITNIAQTKAGMTGDALYGAELAWAQPKQVDMETGRKDIANGLKGLLGEKVDAALLDDSSFTGKLGALLSAEDDSGRLIARAKLLGSHRKSFSDEQIANIDKFVASHGSDSALGGMLTNRSHNLQTLKLSDTIGTMFGGRARMDEYAGVADQFTEIANMSSPAEQVGSVLNRMSNDDTFREALGRDNTLKKLLPLNDSISRSDLTNVESYKKRFNANPMDDLKELQATFDKDGEAAVRARIAGGILSTQSRNEASSGKENEAKLLADAAQTFRDAANIIKQVKER